MEGPFISPAKKGAQDARNILPCNVEICDRFLKASEGLVKFIGIAPEESEHAVEFIREVHERVNVSLAHTNADYDNVRIRHLINIIRCIHKAKKRLHDIGR